MRTFFLTLTTGFALFSMFFGSGNLVFPIEVGKLSAGNVWPASIGFFLTGVLVPFLGAFAMMLFNGSTKQFFACMGRPATFWFPLIALSLMGPFGVLARCITVAHGSFCLLFPETSLVAFSIGMCVVILLAAVKKNRIVPFLGALLTPVLLIALLAIGAFGFYYGSFPDAALGQGFQSFETGFHEGYQLMDLLAAFFFSTFVIEHLNEQMKKAEELRPPLQLFIRAALVGGGLLTCVYFSLIFLGSMYSEQLEGVSSVEMIGTIAQLAIGPLGAPIVSAAVVLACLTTGIVLTSLFAEFFYKEVAHEKVTMDQSLALTLLIAFGVSTFEFAGIARFLGPVLEAIYPALIVLTLFNIFSKMWGVRVYRLPIALTLAAKVLYF